MKRVLVSLLVTLLVSSVLATAFAQTLTVYSGRNEAFIDPVVQLFEAETGVTVEVRYGDTAELAATIFEEGRNSPADVYLAQDAGALGALAKADLFTELPADILDKVEARFRSDDGTWVGVTGRARVLAYNTSTLTEDEIPNSVFDLTSEAWQGRVGWAPTNASFQAFVTAMRVTQGDDVTREWLNAMMANDVKAYPNNTSIVEAVGRGEIDLGLVNHYYLFRFLAEQGESFPVRNHYLSDADIGSLVNVAGAGILKTSEHTDLAEQFVQFLLSSEAQQHFTNNVYEYPLVAGISTNELLLPLADVQTPDIDLSNLDDLEGTLELLQDVGAF